MYAVIYRLVRAVRLHAAAAQFELFCKYTPTGPFLHSLINGCNEPNLPHAPHVAGDVKNKRQPNGVVYVLGWSAVLL